MKISYRLSLLLLVASCTRSALHAVRYALANRWRRPVYDREMAAARRAAKNARFWQGVWAALNFNRVAA